MKFLRHILSHLFLIFFLLAIVSVFYYRTLLLPNDVVSKVDGVVKEVYPPALSFVSKRDYFWSIGGERIVSFDDLTIFEKSSEVVGNGKTEDTTESEVVVESVAKNEVIDKETEPDNKTKTEETLVIAKAEEPVAVKELVVEVVKENEKTEELPAEVKDSDTSSERDLLINARNAFNQGAMNKSEKFYIELTQLDNDNPDIFGELGNVYYSQGKWDEAGQAYYEAAVRLIAERKYNQVAYLQQVIKGLSSDYAEKLSQQMLRK